jgi:hypothetical protein
MSSLQEARFMTTIPFPPNGITTSKDGRLKNPNNDGEKSNADGKMNLGGIMEQTLHHDVFTADTQPINFAFVATCG